MYLILYSGLFLSSSLRLSNDKLSSLAIFKINFLILATNCLGTFNFCQSLLKISIFLKLVFKPSEDNFFTFSMNFSNSDFVFEYIDVSIFDKINSSNLNDSSVSVNLSIIF
jgi:hypothetical protein